MQPTPPTPPTPPSTGLAISVLGPLDVRVDRVPLVADTRKALAILALLAVEARPFARDELAAMFWPESDDEAARGSLRRTLSTLRSGLGGRWLSVDRHQVGLSTTGVTLDLAELERRRTGSSSAVLAAAASLVRGPFLAGFNLRDSPAFDDWRATRASGVERAVGELLDDLATAHEAEGDLAGAITTVTRRLDLDPLDEPAQRRLIGLLADAGDRAGAIRQYRSCVMVLERELGVAPLAETTSLYDSIRDGSFARGHVGGVAPPTPTGSAPASLGASVHGVTAALPFVGRDAELASLVAVHETAVGSGRVAVLEGEPGIGKTRLAAELAQQIAGSGAIVLTAHAHASESGIAYAPIAELLQRTLREPGAEAALADLADGVIHELGRLVGLPGWLERRNRPAVAPSVDPGLARARLLDAIAVVLTALLRGRAPGLLVVDDLQWADASSLELIGYLVRRLEGRPILLLLAWRSEDLGDQALDLARLVETWPASLVLRLGRLDADAVARLVAAAVPAQPGPVQRLVASLLEASEGLPLYLVERLAEPPAEHSPRGSAAVTHGFRALLRERIGRVGETGRQVLAAGAVIGRSFDLATVRAASGRSEDETLSALEDLMRRGLIRETQVGPDLRFDFVHASLREVAYEQTSLVRGRVLHRRVAEVLRAGADRSSDPGDLARLVLIAQHERDAGRDAEAAEAFCVAAERARGIFANREAIELIESALALGHPHVGELQRTLGELRLGLGQYAAAIASFEAAAAQAGELELVELELMLGRAHARRGDLMAARSHLDAALAACGPHQTRTDAYRRVRISVLVEGSVVALRAGDESLATASAEEALSLANDVDDRAGAGMARRIRGLIARSRGELAAARAELAESLVLSDADPHPGASIAAANALALVEAADGNHDGAIALLERALQSARRIGERHLEAAILNNLADFFHATGAGDRSMEYLRLAVALFAEIGGRPGELEPEIWKLETW